jgi:integrase
MVSQRVSQHAQKNLENDTACPQYASEISANLVVPYPNPHGVSPVVEPVSSFHRETKGQHPDGRNNLKQSQGKNPSSHSETTPDLVRAELVLASAAPPPNSREEVSGMPSKGNGCIFKAQTKAGKAVWKVEVTIGYRPDGRRIRTRRTAHSLAAARELHRKLVSELHSGDLKTKSTETFSQYSLWWIRTVKGMSVRPSTLSDYEDRLRRNVFPHFGTRRLHEITSRDVQNWLYILQKQGTSTSTINGARQVFGAVFKHAVRAGLIPKNPVEMTERAKRQWGDKTGVKQPWSLMEAQQVLTATQGTKFDLFARLGILMGARRGEILALRWSDVDFEQGFISIACSLREQRVIQSDGTAKVSLVIGDTKTISSRRKIALTAEILASLQRHRDVVTKMKSAAGDSWKETEWVFVDSLGGLTYPSNFAKQFTKFISASGIRVIRIHDMRHTAAVLSLEAGVRLEAVSQALGHSRIDITKSVYAPYVQPLMTEFAFGLGDYVAPFKIRDLQDDQDMEILYDAR